MWIWCMLLKCFIVLWHFIDIVKYCLFLYCTIKGWYCLTIDTPPVYNDFCSETRIYSVAQIVNVYVWYVCFFIVCLYSVSCPQCYLCLWIVHSWLHLMFSLTFYLLPTPSHHCACPKSEPVFSRPYVMVTLLFNEVIDSFVDIGGVVEHYCLIFLFIMHY
jgi:hypothetical protein